MSWRYDNPGDVQDLNVAATYVTDLPAEQSRTGVAFKNASTVSLVTIPDGTKELWFRFDVYLTGQNPYSRHILCLVGDVDNTFHGLQIGSSGGSFFIHGERKASCPVERSGLYTGIIHAVSDAEDGLIELWLNGSPYAVYRGNVNNGEDITTVKLYSEYYAEAALFSNLTLTDGERLAPIASIESWQVERLISKSESATVTASIERRISNATETTGSIERRISNVVEATGSIERRLTNAATATGSIERRLTNAATVTAAVERTLTRTETATAAIERKITGMAGDINKVTEDDIIAGLAKVSEVYPRFGLIPGPIIAPKWSMDSNIIAAMKAACTDINGCFKTTAIADVSTYVSANATEATRGAATYSDVNAAKNNRNMTDAHLIACWPRVALGGKKYYLSTHVAALMLKTDAAHDDLPYKSPSNESLQIDRAFSVSGGDVWLGKTEANLLNGQGVVTAFRFGSGWKAWGNRTSIYPETTDPKDAFIPVRRMVSWVANTLIVSYFSRIDEPISKRQIESICDEVQIYFNGLVARGALVGGSIQFLEDENPVTDLSDGIVRFHIQICPPSPAREIVFNVEYQPKMYEGIWE